MNGPDGPKSGAQGACGPRGSTGSPRPELLNGREQSEPSKLDTYLAHLNRLIHRGRELRDNLAADPGSGEALASTSEWRRDCEAMVTQLSGGSKAHWLARAYSQAFLIRSSGDRIVEEADVAEIVGRLVSVLERAGTTLSRTDTAIPASASFREAPQTRRFDFVHNAELRPILEQAYSDSRDALDQGRFGPALAISCGILEAIVTDALEDLRYRSLAALAACDAPKAQIADWSFETRIAVAERAGLIHRGCARLPPAARKHRDLTDTDGELHPTVTISEREARLAGQVLRVVMRDLDPGR